MGVSDLLNSRIPVVVRIDPNLNALLALLAKACGKETLLQQNPLVLSWQ